jgi:acyl-CoA synthetase (AMP-forming)/AMP-acid ligase II
VVLLEGFDSDNFWKLIRDEQINFVQLVPSILSELLMTSDNFTPGDQSSLVFIGSASAPHPPELVSRFEQTFGVYVLQGYGMTEATCTISLNPLKMEDRRPGSVGMPISVNNVTVLDDNGRSLHVGKTGRVMVSGRNVALNVSSASIRNRIDAEDPVLETGDLGYVDEDGFLWLVGRETDMIKRGGYRISPVEIENEIMKYLDDVEVAVVGVPHPLLGQDIVVFISGSKFADLNSRKLLGKIKKTMASYKVPSRLIHVDSLPKLAVGKVDRQRLREDYRKYHCNKYN